MYKNHIVSIIAAIIIFVFLSLLYLNYEKNEYKFEMFFILFSFIPFSIIFLIGVYIKGYNILHPYLMVSVLYLLLFIVSPMINIYLDNTDCHGDYIMNGCIKGTGIFLLGYMFFTVGYILPHKTTKLKVYVNSFEGNKKIIYICYFMWFIGAVSCIYYIHKSSVAITALLLTDNQMELSLSAQKLDNTNLKFLSNFAYFMVFPCIILSQLKPKNKYVYVIIAITIFLFFLRGTRIFILILLLAYIIVLIRKNDYQIKMYHIVIGLILFLFMITFIGSNRNNVKKGESSDAITLEDVSHALDTNLDLYKPYYGLVANCPKKAEYTYGEGIFMDSFVSLIPRILWSNKRQETSMSKTMRQTTGEGPIYAGMSWPNIAEYYMDFGICGVIVFSIILGYVLSKSISLYNSFDLRKIILYAVLFPTYFQLIIRGYTPINFIMYICLLFPYYIILPYRTKSNHTCI